MSGSPTKQIRFYGDAKTDTTGSARIVHLTDAWFDLVVRFHDPPSIRDRFCDDGNLLGTVSQTIRRDDKIREYFEYFARQPGIRILERVYNISHVEGDVWLNTAFVTWWWDKLPQPLVARMTFLFRRGCIVQLHSSALPKQHHVDDSQPRSSVS